MIAVLSSSVACALYANVGAIGALLTPIRITGPQHMAMLIPLCFAISIVYKTIRCPNLRDVPVSALLLCMTIVLGMYAVGVGVWLIFLILA